MFITFLFIANFVLCILGWIYLLFEDKIVNSKWYIKHECKQMDRETIELFLSLSYNYFKKYIDTWCEINNMKVVNGRLEGV